jgi:hypothetical protein
VLPDDALLEIFDFFVVRDQDLPSYRNQPAILISNEISKHTVEWWQPLVHVCRRWRDLVFRSRRRLNLRLCCIVGTTTRKTLDVWPALPLFILDVDIIDTPLAVDNLISLLEHSNRICQIHLDIRFLTTSQIEKVWTAMQVPFPELTDLTLESPWSRSETVPVVPDSFLGGSAPRLRHLSFLGIPFPELQKLLLSATHLVELHLWGIPLSGYISPEDMVTYLSVLTSLERLELGFDSPQSSPDQESGPHTPPPTRSVLPTVMSFQFRGVNEYLEDLLARIDAPRLYRLSILFFNDIDFDTPQLIQFIGRTLTFKPPNEAHVVSNSGGALFKLQSQASDFERVQVDIAISCRTPGWQLSALAQICTSFSPHLSAAESLYICEDLHPSSKVDWKDDIENTEWLEFLLPFTAVKNFYISKEFGPRIAPALQELDEGRMTAVLPTLQNIFLEGFQPSESVEEGIGWFISGRQLTNHPITISSWDRDPERAIGG